MHLVVSVGVVLTNCAFSFQESTDLEDEDEEDDKVGVCAHERMCTGTLTFSAGSIPPA